ncbi:glycosyltransferase family 4 protein [Ignavibacterium sp.]|uniref:glycosyltransferase family 4 protein n=1 Tax=Ignavibacterium sp. TaxID=2651167 RepID=UPI0021FDC171|nr:glycosyltransferase family 4 protein [Ignavibacterium sp.]BDQ04194.1 MAG: glycosyl transferase family 1 [Ignavibacterium sp.]
MNSSFKILIVDHNFEFSGSLISVSYLIKEFVKNRFEVFILTKAGEKEKEFLTSLGSKVISYSNSNFRSITLSFHISDKTSPFSYQWFKNLIKDILYFFNGIFLSVKVINKVKPDLIYLNEYVTAQFALYAKLKSIPSVVHIRSLFIDQKFNFRIFILKTILRKVVTLNFAITELEAAQIGKEKKVNTIVVPEFLDESDFKTPPDLIHIKKKYGIGPNDKVILFLGGINAIKGTLIFIKAINKIKYPDTKFLIAGNIQNNPQVKKNYDYYIQCTELINSSTRKNAINILGNVTNINEIISIADIIVSCSVESHFSRPIIEAWAQKKAVVASDIQHNINLINKGVDGILYPSNDSDSLAKALDNLLYDENLRLRIAEKGLSKAKENFLATKNVKIILNALKKLANGNQSELTKNR